MVTVQHMGSCSLNACACIMPRGCDLGGSRRRVYAVMEQLKPGQQCVFQWSQTAIQGDLRGLECIRNCSTQLLSKGALCDSPRSARTIQSP